MNRLASSSSRSAPLFGLAPDGVCRARPVTRPAGELLPRRFTLTAGVTQASRPRRSIFCGTVPIRSRIASPGRWALPTIAPCGVRTFLRGTSPDPSRHRPVSPPRRLSPGARRSSRPPRTQLHHTGRSPGEQPALSILSDAFSIPPPALAASGGPGSPDREASRGSTVGDFGFRVRVDFRPLTRWLALVRLSTTVAGAARLPGADDSNRR